MIRKNMNVTNKLNEMKKTQTSTDILAVCATQKTGLFGCERVKIHIFSSFLSNCHQNDVVVVDQRHLSSHTHTH